MRWIIWGLITWFVLDTVPIFSVIGDCFTEWRNRRQERNHSP